MTRTEVLSQVDQSLQFALDMEIVAAQDGFIMQTVNGMEADPAKAGYRVTFLTDQINVFEDEDLYLVIHRAASSLPIVEVDPLAETSVVESFL